jgi:molecular chaperone GrpE
MDQNDAQKEEVQNPQTVDNNASEQLQKERDEYLEGWKRAKADLANYRKEEAQRLQHILMSANEQLIKELLVVLDSFDLAIESLEKEEKAEKGVYLIRSQMEDVLKKFGLERVAVKKGDDFDPSQHEAIATVESEQESETVVEEVERGYRLNGKLVRPARVKVSK